MFKKLYGTCALSVLLCTQHAIALEWYAQIPLKIVQTLIQAPLEKDNQAKIAPSMDPKQGASVRRPSLEDRLNLEKAKEEAGNRLDRLTGKKSSVQPDQAKKTPSGFKQIVGGIPTQIQDVVDMLEADANGESVYEYYGLKYPKGILMVGPPGTGKTLIAKAISEELDCGFVETSASVFSQMYVGAGPAVVRQKFAEAKEAAQESPSGKAILFIDEAEVIGSRMNKRAQDTDAKNIIAELLTHMDGLASDKSVIVIAATNDPNSLDPAFLRDGRFGTIVNIPLPDAQKRKALLEYYAKGRPIDSSIKWDKYVEETDKFNAADMKGLVDKAAFIAMREKSKQITVQHFDKALKTALEERARRTTSYL
jgi:ATP-dependent 26S proteasome regulatory subunit